MDTELLITLQPLAELQVGHQEAVLLGSEPSPWPCVMRLQRTVRGSLCLESVAKEEERRLQG